MKTTQPPIIVQETFNTPIQTVWASITAQEQMTQWFFQNIPSFEAKVGFETQFIVGVEDRVFPHIWKITEVEAPNKITYDWSYEGYEGRALVTFELFEEGNQTKLILTNKVLEDFQSDIPEFKRESGVEGWNYFIQQSLKEYLEKKA